MLFLFLLPVIFAFLYRCRGGLLPLGSTQAARVMYWGIPNAIAGMFAANMLDAPLYVGFACGVLAWASATIKHGLWMGAETVHDCEVMAFIGAVQGLAMILPLMLYKHGLFFLFPLGALEGVCYYFGRLIEGRNLALFRFRIATDRAEWGEVLTGGVFGFMWLFILGSLWH